MYCMYQDREELEDDLYQEEDRDSEGSEVNSEVEFHLYSQLHYSSNAGELEEKEEEEGSSENTAGADKEQKYCFDVALPSPDVSKVQQHLKKNKKRSKEEGDEQKKRKSDPKRQGSFTSSLFQEVIVIDSSPEVISVSEDDTADDEGVCSLKGERVQRLHTSTPAQQRDQKKMSLGVPVTVDSSSSESDSDDSESKSESNSSESSHSSESSDSDGLENWMILGREKQHEDQSISLNLEGGSDSNADAEEEEEEGSWLVSDKDKDAQIYNKDKGARTSLQRVSNRYYTSKNVHCRNCNKTGHLSKNCHEPKKVLPCYLCGTPGHLVRDCPNRHCNNCGLPGHLYDSCSERAYWHKQCHRCGMKGHFFDLCPEIWRQYHITTKTGPPVKQRGEDNGRSPAYCYNCSRQGHFGHACTRQRMFNGVYATIPFISHYDTAEDIKRRQHRVKMKVKELKKNGCFSNTSETPVTPGPPKKKKKLNHHNNHTPHQTSQNHKPSPSHIYFDNECKIQQRNKFSKCKPQQITSNVKPWKPKRPVPTSRDPRPPAKVFLDEADDFPRGGGKGRGIVSKKGRKNNAKVKEQPKNGKRDRRPDHLFGEKGKKKRNQAQRSSDKKYHASVYPTDENLFIIKQRKRSR